MAFTARRTFSSRSKWLTLLAVCLGLMMLMIDTFVVNIAFPAIGRGLRASLSEAEWTVSGYVLVMGVLPIAMGRLGDLYGRRRLYLLGLVLFIGSSIACGLSQSIGELILFRVTQGAGAAIMTPLTLSIVTHAFPAAQRGLAIGIWGGVSGLGLIAGPILGGLLVRGDNWRWIFFINVPVGLLALALALLFVPESRDEGAERGVDWAGLALLSSALFLIVYGLTRANDLGWGSPVILGSLVGGAVLLPAFVTLEWRIRRPLIDLTLFRSGTFVMACLAAFLFNAAVFGSQPYSSLLLQNTWGFSPLEAGFAFVPATALVALITPFSGILGQRLGGRLRLVMMTGSLLVVVSALYMLRLDLHSGYADTFLPAFVIRGAGIGLFIAATSLAVMSAVPVAKSGLASGTLTMARQIGTSLGVALLGGVYLHHVDGALGGTSPGATRQQAAALRGAAQQAIIDGFVGISLVMALLGMAAALAALFIRHRPATDVAIQPSVATAAPGAVAAQPLPAAVLD